MSFEITNLIPDAISLTEKSHTVPAGQAPRGVYFATEHYENDCWYIKNHYDDPSLSYGKATISTTDRFGNFLGKKTLDHLIFRIKHSTASIHKFITLSFGLSLYYYTHDEYIVNDISKDFTDRYQAQCVDISINGEILYYSNQNSIVQLDSSLNLLRTWKIPDKFNRQNRASSPEVRQALTVLDLPQKPNSEAIRVAFRKKLLRVHPDIHKDDPNASDKTREIIEAYEVLTRGSQNNIKAKSEKQIIQFDFGYHGDFVTATQTKSNNKGIFVGCYSGKLYSLSRSGKSKLVYECHAPIRKIKESGRYVYIVTDHFWDILCDGKAINRIEGSFRLERIVLDGNCNAVMSNRQNVRLFSPGGIAFAEVNFQENISDVYMFNKNLKVITGKKTYIFSLKIPTDYKILESNNMFLPDTV